AEDCIRVRNVTGVQTCALPISPPSSGSLRSQRSPNNTSSGGEVLAQCVNLLAIEKSTLKSLAGNVPRALRMQLTISSARFMELAPTIKRLWTLSITTQLREETVKASS